jgi:hypothetical protein
MVPTLGDRLKALFAAKDELGLELVMTANGLAAVGIGAMAWLQFGLSIGWAAGVVVAGFVLLTACLLFRSTAWVAAGIGGLTIAASTGLLAFTLVHGGRQGRLIAGAVGALAGLAVAIWTYAGVGRIARAGESPALRR